MPGVGCTSSKAFHSAIAVMDAQRQSIGANLQGHVLEIGPGARPYPTAPGACVTYADRSVAGGRELNWPELKGAPAGPQADYDIDLDHDGLGALADASQDAVVASHVIEHLANPVAALVEFQRVLRPGGQLVLVVPDRHHTFDWVRRPTSFTHLWEEYQAGVVEVSRAHILEFCRAISMQPPLHPPQVRAWHDPRCLDDRLLALHRRRSIHVHCWAPEEFASLLANLLWKGTLSFSLAHAYFVEDLEDGHGDEFGFVLVKDAAASSPSSVAERFAHDWSVITLEKSRASPQRLLRLQAALRRDATDAGPVLGAVVMQALAERRLRPRRPGPQKRDLRRLVLRGRQAVRELLLPAARPQLPQASFDPG